MNRPLPLIDPGFDPYAPIVPQPRRGHGLAIVGAALVLAIFAIFAGLALVLFLHLDRPTVIQGPLGLRGTAHPAPYVPPPGPRERDLASREVGDVERAITTDFPL